MKKTAGLILFLSLAVLLPCIATEQKGAVVDMSALLNRHPQTAKAEALLEERVAAMEKEKDTLAASLEKQKEEIESLMKQSANKAISDQQREKLRDEADAKLQKLREMDMEARRTMENRRKDLNEEKMIMHKNIVADISAKVAEYAGKNGYAFVFDSSGIGVNGMPSIVFAGEGADITKEILKLIVPEEKKDKDKDKDKDKKKK